MVARRSEPAGRAACRAPAAAGLPAAIARIGAAMLCGAALSLPVSQAARAAEDAPQILVAQDSAPTAPVGEAPEDRRVEVPVAKIRVQSE